MDFFQLIYSQKHCLIENEYKSGFLLSKCCFLRFQPGFNLVSNTWMGSCQPLDSRNDKFNKRSIKNWNFNFSIFFWSLFLPRKGTYIFIFPKVLPSWKQIHHNCLFFTYIFPKALPNWKRIYKLGFFTHIFPKVLPNWKRIHKWIYLPLISSQKYCLIGNKYISGVFFTYIFPKVLPNWKQIHKWSFLHLYIPKSIA